jgi:DNA-binding response OmpR family regulator
MAAPPPPASPPPAARIVVVEDDPVIQELLDTVLTDDGYTVLVWTQGEGAATFIHEVQPDLVILDLWLEHPQAGSMVLGLLMVNPATRQIPVIICSAYRQLLGDQEAQVRAQGYVIVDKPYAIEVLLAQVHALLGGNQARAVGGT